MSIILDRNMADEVQPLPQSQSQPEPRLQTARRRSQTSRLERSVNACQRCRARKQKCDLQYPKCGSCVRTNSRCLIYDSSKGAEVPRDYVQGLESELTQLKKELEELRAQRDSPQSSMGESHQEETRPDTTGDRREDDTELVISMARVALGSTNEPRFMGTSSGVTLAKLVMAAIEMPRSPSQPETFVQLPTSLATVPSSLPPSHVASHLLDIYFKYRTPFFTFLSRTDTESSFRYVYENQVSANNPDFDQERMNRELFLVYMVISIGLIIGLKHHSSSLQQSEGCFNSALRYIDDVLAYQKSNLETLTNVLLLAQYVMMCPAKGSLWQISGVALRLCIDLGLHWESTSFCRTDPVVLDTRRRLFWTTYKIERLLSMTLGRPFGIVDQSINVGMPSVIPNSQPGHSNSERRFSALQEQVSNHLTLIFQLESEIKHVLYHQCKPSSLAFPRPNWKAWYPDISRRLEDWVAEIPCDRDHVYPGHSDAWWNSLHSNALLLLHRPSPAIPHPPADSLIICSFAARKQILSIRELYREKKIDVPWIWVHRLFLAGLTTTYCLWHSSEVREQTRFEDLMETMQACSSVLSALAERFPGASGCRDSFDRLSAATLKHFTTNDRPLSNRTHQILQHTDFSSPTGQFTSSLSTKTPVTMTMETPRTVHRELFVPLDELHLDNIFPFDDMDLGETLSSTAQWPSYPFTDYFGGQE